MVVCCDRPVEPASDAICVEPWQDAIVIGGGPAGAIVSLLLARQGWRVALVEKGEINRPKTCGECLNSRAVNDLRRIGVWGRIEPELVGRTDSVRVHGGDGRVLALPLPGGVLVDRRRLDQSLRDAAAEGGVQVLQPAAARVAAVDIDHVVVNVSEKGRIRALRSALVVGADGVGSAVARAMGLAQDIRAGRKFGFSFDLSAGESDGEEIREAIPAGAICMFMGDGGYLGVVRRRDGTLHAAGLVGAAGAGRAGGAGGRAQPVEFVRLAAMSHPELRGIGLAEMSRERMRAFIAAGPMPWRPRVIANGVAALVGDAAGYIEPFTGEGMSWAIEGALALGAVAGSLRPGAWNAAAASHWTGMWNDRIRRRQVICNSLSHALERPRVARMLLRTGSMWPGLARRIAGRVVAS